MIKRNDRDKGIFMTRIRAALRTISIRTELIVVIIVFALSPALILSVLFYSKLNDLVKEQVSSYASRIVEQASGSVEDLAQEIEVIWKQVVDIAVTTDYLFSSNLDLPPTKVESIFTAETFLKGLRRSFPYLSNVYIIGSGGRMVSSAQNADARLLIGKPWVAEAWNGPAPGMNARIISSDYFDKAATRPTRVLSVISRIMPWGEAKNSLLIVLDFDYEKTLKRIDSVLMSGDSWMMIYNDIGRILYHPDVSRLEQGAEDVAVSKTAASVLFRAGWEEGPGALVIGRRIRGVGWVLSEITTKALTGELAKILNLYLLALAGLIGVCIALSIFTANRLTRPLFHIIRGMDGIREGNFTAQVEEDGNKEFVELVRSFRFMQTEISSLMESIALKERETVRAELLSLQFQINPHFLYNTMDVLRGIAYERKALDIADMAESLGNLFRYAKGGGEGGASLSTEIERLGDYIKIQKYRFRDRFRFSVDVGEDCLQAVVPRFMLQPIVENAFQHGIEDMEKDGEILLGAKRVGSDLVVTVRDNGRGMDASELKRVREGLEAGRESANSGIGFANVHNRVRLRFGESYGLSIASGKGSGTSVTIRMPYGEVPW